MIIKLLNDVKDILNDQVFEIFESLKSLSENLNAYFAGGLTDESKATDAVENSQNIGQQTRGLTATSKGEEYSGPGSAYAQRSDAAMHGSSRGGSQGPTAFNEEQENEEDEVIIE